MRTLLVTALALMLIASTAPSSRAAWPNNPLTNLAVTAVSNFREAQVMVPDGAGGVILAWSDSRNLNQDIYAHHILASGVVDPAWPANGRALCIQASNQNAPSIVSDGAGGAIVAWHDNRFGDQRPFAQHVLASGVVDPAWPTDGQALSTVTGTTTSPKIVTDGAGGAIVAWHEKRAGNFDVFAQHVLASGAVDPAWPPDGRAMVSDPGIQNGAQAISDGAGGAIVTWIDQRSGTPHIYAQRVLPTGVVDPAWPLNGREICNSHNNDQINPVIASDGTGGAIIAWLDRRNAVDYDIYAQHVSASGVVDPSWPTAATALCSATADQEFARIIPDGANGAIVAWQDLRNGTTDIYAQHVLATGLVDAGWPLDGRGVCVSPGGQTLPTLAGDGAGGAFLTWPDDRGTSRDIYAHHVLATGALDPAWLPKGNAVCTAVNTQDAPVILSDENGGAIVAWNDTRTTTTRNIYAQRIGRYGYLGTPEPELLSVQDVPNDQGGRVKVSWGASYLESDPYNLVTSYKVFRSVPPNLAAAMRGAGAQVMRVSDAAADVVERPGMLFTTSAAGTTYFWEYLATVNVDFLSGYSYLAATAQDSTAPGDPATAFMVQARTAGTQHWESIARTGSSVDNLAPGAPTALTGQYVGGTTHLSWAANLETDLAEYRLYRGTSAGFVPGPDNQVATVDDTTYADAAGAPAYYKLTAVDVHGNESPVALLAPSSTTDVGDGPAELKVSLAPASPNPAARSTQFRYALPRASDVRLAVFDPAGRRVRVLASGFQTAGQHSASWDLRDDGGQPVGMGLYFVRLEADGRAVTRRVAVSR